MTHPLPQQTTSPSAISPPSTISSPSTMSLRLPLRILPSRHFSALCLTGLALLGALSQVACSKVSKAETNEAVVEAPASVESEKVIAVASPRLLRLTGTLRGSQEADLAANVSGKILKTSVERGQKVEKGDLLAQVDTQAAQLALAEAKVSVETSKTQEEINKADCERYEKLRQSGAVSDLEYDQVTAKCRTAPLSVEAAQARQRIAAKNVGDGMIRSPFSGVVTERYVEVGEYVQSSSKVVSLASVGDLRLVFSVPEKNYPDVKMGATVSIQVAAYNETKFTGTVSHISGAVRATRDVVVEATVENPEGKLLPGMFADISLSVGEEQLPSVPQAAVFEENGKSNVFVVQAGVLLQRVVQPAPAVGDRIPIQSGVTLGEQIVTRPEPSLENGQKVK